VAQRHDSPFALKPDQKGRIWDVTAVMRSLLDGPLAKASGDSILNFDGSRRMGALPLRKLGLISQPIGPKWQDARRRLCDQSGWKWLEGNSNDRD
jgi:hypothetical protein